ncbi:hypothetical protein RRG08_048629 [Elysia crispata]|uniref:Uncharacterized protein n=1 Tax=Elysia crispata TaxID=231223 RepID=A0AAE1ACP2_9GAST|nr:hypothetical protein RRG08_048629 [Elysia crispata]
MSSNGANATPSTHSDVLTRCQSPASDPGFFRFESPSRLSLLTSYTRHQASCNRKPSGRLPGTQLTDPRGQHPMGKDKDPSFIGAYPSSVSTYLFDALTCAGFPTVSPNVIFSLPEIPELT